MLQGFYRVFKQLYAKLFTYFVSLDLLLEALFLWITFFFANLSNMPETCFNNEAASSLSVVFFSLLMKVRVVLA